MYNPSKATKAFDYLQTHTPEETCTKFNIENETLNRYIRHIKWLEKPHHAKILLIDIETAPMEVYVWDLRHNDYISPQNIKKSFSLLTWSAKWLCEAKTMSARVSIDEAFNREDYSIITKAWSLLDKADIVIAHNGKRFDIKKLNARFILHRLMPPSPYVVIDTLLESRKNFGFPSHSLDYIQSQFDDAERKLETSMKLWDRCVTGDKKAIKEMETYNKQDVAILEDWYMRMRPWIKSHPNLGLFVEVDEPVCPNCASSVLEWNGYYQTPANLWAAFRCQCGAIGRARKGALKPKNLTLSVAR